MVGSTPSRTSERPKRIRRMQNCAIYPFILKIQQLLGIWVHQAYGCANAEVLIGPVLSSQFSRGLARAPKPVLLRLDTTALVFHVCANWNNKSLGRIARPVRRAMLTPFVLQSWLLSSLIFPSSCPLKAVPVRARALRPLLPRLHN